MVFGDLKNGVSKLLVCNVLISNVLAHKLLVSKGEGGRKKKKTSETLVRI